MNLPFRQLPVLHNKTTSPPAGKYSRSITRVGTQGPPTFECTFTERQDMLFRT